MWPPIFLRSYKLLLLCGMSALRVFSLASLPERYENLTHIIPVILAQADVLHIHWVGYKTPVSEAWQDPKIIHHHWSKAGSQIKFQPYNLYKNAYFFPVDDDILYPSNYAEKMIEAMQHYNNKVVCCLHGNIIDLRQRGDFYTKYRKNINFKNALSANRRVLLPGTGTTCFYTPLAKLNYHDYIVYNMSDVYTGCFLAKQHIPVIAIQREAMWLQPMEDFDVRIFGNNPNEAIDREINRHRWYFRFNRYWFKCRYRL